MKPSPLVIVPSAHRNAKEIEMVLGRLRSCRMKVVFGSFPQWVWRVASFGEEGKPREEGSGVG